MPFLFYQGPPQVFDKDYDFEKANEQFREKIIEDLNGKLENLELKKEKDDTKDKEKEEATVTVDVHVVVDENEKSAIAADVKTAEELQPEEKSEVEKKLEEFYDKTKSFFDNISCDALEKESGLVSISLEGQETL